MGQELQELVDDLQLTLDKKEEEHESVKRREERARKHIEDENDELRRKAALGWMLGCLSGLSITQAWGQRRLTEVLVLKPTVCTSSEHVSL